ncbi:MAG: flagellar basal body-associated protein FliL [Maribacter sp.]|jgi:flagellar basal body-associated protein FliL
MLSILLFAIVIIIGALIAGIVIFFVAKKQDKENENILDN